MKDGTLKFLHYRVFETKHRCKFIAPEPESPASVSSKRYLQTCHLGQIRFVPWSASMSSLMA